MKKLRDNAVQHGAAPYHRLVARVEQAHGDHLHSLHFDGDDLAIHRRERLLSSAEHDGDVGAVDVRVKQADFGTGGAWRSDISKFRESEGEIYCDSGLADAPFARGNGDEVFDARDRLGLRRLWCGRWTWRHRLGDLQIPVRWWK